MKTLTTFILMFSLSFAVTSAFAMGGDDDGPSIKQYETLIEQEKYQEAIDGLNEALAEDADSADLLNLVAYSHRQLKRYDIALNYYLKALEIDPDHRGANEYLGELYLHLGQLDKALERRKVIDADCLFSCKELKALDAAIEAYREQNPS